MTMKTSDVTESTADENIPSDLSVYAELEGWELSIMRVGKTEGICMVGCSYSSIYHGCASPDPPPRIAFIKVLTGMHGSLDKPLPDWLRAEATS